MSTKTLVSLVSGLSVLVIASLVFLYETETIKPQDPLDVLWSGNYTKERTFWKKEIDKVGTEKAYEAFKLETNGKEFGIAHTLSHIMGELIYEKEGIKGIVVCDASFAFGCYHSFFGRAITDGGVESVFALDQECVKRFGLDRGLGCAHGIGHGLLGYLGDEKLVDALNTCNKLSWKEKLGGCSSGVFMEYNFHTMQTLKGAVNRVFNPDRPYEPCTDIPKENRQACYFDQPQWWLRTFSDDFTKVGIFCQGVEDKTEQRACYLGIGNVAAPSADYDVKKTRQECSMLPNQEARAFCLARAAWAFISEPSAYMRAPEVCEGLSTSELRECPSLKDISRGVNKI
jgi:hypothetical protein